MKENYERKNFLKNSFICVCWKLPHDDNSKTIDLLKEELLKNF